MSRASRFLACAVALVTMSAAGSTASARGNASTWRLLPRAPVALVDEGAVSVWTGRQLIVFGRVTTMTGADEVDREYVGAAYSPATDSWRRLPALPKPVYGIYGYSAVWTGTEVLVWGQGIGVAFNPATGRWRRLPRSPMDGAALVVWTGRELVGWGGGCCGDAWSTGVAYDPTTNRWRALPRSPLHGAQHPIGAWTGRELIVLVGGPNPVDGKPWPARFARAAAYDPRTNTWRRIALPPATRDDATAVWDGHDLLLVGGYLRFSPSPLPWKLARTLFAYDPAANRWRRLASMPSARRDVASVWTGRKLLVLAGTTDPGGGARTRLEAQARGFAYDRNTNAWTTLPPAPLRGRVDPTAVWTGRSLIVWGGSGFLAHYRGFTDGAVLTGDAL